MTRGRARQLSCGAACIPPSQPHLTSSSTPPTLYYIKTNFAHFHLSSDTIWISVRPQWSSDLNFLKRPVVALARHGHGVWFLQKKSTNIHFIWAKFSFICVSKYCDGWCSLHQIIHQVISHWLSWWEWVGGRIGQSKRRSYCRKWRRRTSRCVESSVHGAEKPWCPS